MMDIIKTLKTVAERTILFEDNLYFRGGEDTIVSALIEDVDKWDVSAKMLALEDLKTLVGDFHYEVICDPGKTMNKMFSIFISSHSTLGFEEVFWKEIGQGLTFFQNFYSSSIEDALFNAITMIAYQYIRINAKQIPTENVTE